MAPSARALSTTTSSPLARTAPRGAEEPPRTARARSSVQRGGRRSRSPPRGANTAIIPANAGRRTTRGTERRGENQRDPPSAAANTIVMPSNSLTGRPAGMRNIGSAEARREVDADWEPAREDAMVRLIMKREGRKELPIPCPRLDPDESPFESAISAGQGSPGCCIVFCLSNFDVAQTSLLAVVVWVAYSE